MTQFKSEIPDLDHTEIHSPAVVKAWKESKQQERAAFDAKQTETARAALAEQQRSNAPMSDDDYYQEALKRERQKRERELTAKLEEEAAAQQRKDFLASSPEQVQILERNPASFCTEFAHWISRGYEFATDSVDFQFPHLFAVNLNKPIKQKAK